LVATGRICRIEPILRGVVDATAPIRSHSRQSSGVIIRDVEPRRTPDSVALELTGAVVVGGREYDPAMESGLPPVTADELDRMTPDQRREEFRRRIVTDPSELSDELREKIRATAERLDHERRRAG